MYNCMMLVFTKVDVY